VKRFLDTFTGDVRTSCPVRSVTRAAEGVRLAFDAGESQTFDEVVIAAHADEALALLADPSDDERAWLGAWGYSRNRVLLHTDEALMPPVRRAWASWNYLRPTSAAADAPACLTYYMNRLQSLRCAAPYLVTLNPLRPVRPAARIAEFLYEHPLFTAAAVASQGRLPELNGRRHTHFCGSYFNNGFHEDAVASAVAVASRFDCTL
jgi:predicted NAD/FAD-binding protein